MTRRILPLVLALFVSCLGNAFAFDVNAQDAHYVRITRDRDLIRFEDCHHGAIPECTRTLGPAEWYSIKTLHTKHVAIIRKAYGSLAADVGIVVLVASEFAVGGIAVATFSSAVGDAFFEAATEFSLIGLDIGAGTGLFIRATRDLNSYELFMNAAVLKNDVIQNKPTRVHNLDRWIKRMDKVLTEN